MPGVRVACTGRDAVVDVPVAVEGLGEPHEAPGELGLGHDGRLLEYHLKVNLSTSLGKKLITMFWLKV